MSINDLMNDDSLIPTIVGLMGILIIIMVIALPFAVAKYKKHNKEIYGDDEYGATHEEKNAKIIARRSVPHPHLNQSPYVKQQVMINMIIFELENGNRVEFAIKDPTTYETLIVGDCGTLTYQGKRFIRFEREKVS